ncbi:hypothetical protein AMTRI_Chr08g165060 [Amborella trichopoda]
MGFTQELHFSTVCLPNACRYFHGIPNTKIMAFYSWCCMFDYIDKLRHGNTDVIIRALHDIAEGKRLFEDYGFVCECDRCMVEKTWKEDDEEEDEEMALKNKEDDQEFPHCGGTMGPLPPSQGTPSNTMECNVCSQLRREEELNGDEDEDDMVDD